ncbi:MAG TPA: cytochrome c-type biogenesis protein CcmH, partial [Candidatus Binatia bacterium]
MIMRMLKILLMLWLLSATAAHAAATPDLDDRTREVATELRCVVCQNLSVADSPSDMAQQMRGIVREQLQAGKTPDQIKDFFVSKYGEWVLLKPRTTGVSALLWILPYVVLVFGIIAALWFARRWSAKKVAARSDAAATPISPQARNELLNRDAAEPDIEDTSARAQLARERSRLRNELSELDFDFQSGKLSESDFEVLKRDIENKGATVISQLHALPAEAPVKHKAPQRATTDKAAKSDASTGGFKRWQIISGGVFLLLFGLALGVMLTKSIRPRGGENDTMTGDFLTGTTPANSETTAALAEGKEAFGRQDYPKAIEAFKKVLNADPNNPEAHSYMGFILMQ